MIYEIVSASQILTCLSIKQLQHTYRSNLIVFLVPVYLIFIQTYHASTTQSSVKMKPTSTHKHWHCGVSEDFNIHSTCPVLSYISMFSWPKVRRLSSLPVCLLSESGVWSSPDSDCSSLCVFFPQHHKHTSQPSSFVLEQNLHLLQSLSLSLCVLWLTLVIVRFNMLLAYFYYTHIYICLNVYFINIKKQ